MLKKIVITGLNSVIGADLLENKYFKNFQIIDFYHHHKAKNNHPNLIHVGCNLMDAENIYQLLSKYRPDFIIHMGAITHIDDCQTDKANGKNGHVWQVNVSGTKSISNYSKENSIPLIFLSTECVFSGDKTYYTEDDDVGPKNWYGETKAQAEKILKNNSLATIIRGVIAYDFDLGKKTILSALLRSLKKKKEFYVVNDQFFTPTYIPDIHQAIVKIMQNGLTGIFHVTSPQTLTPFEFAKLVAGYFGEDTDLIKGQSMMRFFEKKRAKLRLINACLNCETSSNKLGFIPKSPENILKSKS